MKKNYPTRQSHFSVRWLPALLLLVASIAATSVSSYAQSTQPVEVAGKVTDNYIYINNALSADPHEVYYLHNNRLHSMPFTPKKTR